MKIDEKIISALDSLVNESEEIYKSGFNKSSFIKESHFNVEKSSAWHTKFLNLLATVFQRDSEHYQKLKSLDENVFLVTNFQKAVGVLKAAKNDYENDYLFDTRTLIEAEVFDEFLEQAEELFKKGYYQASAVIAGCVLEDGLRKLCQHNNITLPAKATIDPMNVELAKAGIYNKLIQKKITALADLRNKAAHGEWTEFTEKDVEDMIRDVRRFMEDYFS
jgi:uncharacterized protein (UPF0332 family)